MIFILICKSVETTPAWHKPCRVFTSIEDAMTLFNHHEVIPMHVLAVLYHHNEKPVVRAVCRRRWMPQTGVACSV